MIRALRPQNVLLSIVNLVFTCFQLVHGDQTLDRLNHFFNHVTTLEANFHQDVFDENGIQMQRSSGHMKLFRPGRFLWEYVNPTEQLILADGQNLWIYDVALEQASVKPMEQSLSSAPIALLTELRPLKKDFDIKEAPVRANLDWVRLTPKLSDTEFHRVEIGFDGEDIKQMELYDQFGQKTVIILSDLKTNIPMQPSQFRFDVPPGVDVIGGEQ